MSAPVLHVLAGPNGAGKSKLAQHLVAVTQLPFAEERDRKIAAGESFITETRFSHPSKLAAIHAARAVGFRVTLHVVIVPVDLAVARVESRAAMGGHSVPEDKIRSRFARLWPLVAAAIADSDESVVYDNSRAHPALRAVARFRDGRATEADWPAWTPTELTSVGAA